MKNPFKSLLTKKPVTTIITVERLKELEQRSRVLDNVLDTMNDLKGMSELECNLELVVGSVKEK